MQDAIQSATITELNVDDVSPWSFPCALILNS